MKELPHWIALHQALHASPTTMTKLLEQLTSPKAIIEQSHSLKIHLTTQQYERLQAIDWSAVDDALEWLQQSEHHIVTISDADYPVLLKEIYDPPPLLYIVGEKNCLSDTQLAIVGSRKATPHGNQLAFEFASNLAHAGITITSGMALGIDADAHRGALSVNKPTIAVLGCGVDIVYPKQHRKLAKAISSNGTILSELPLGSPPIAQNFPKRNRIVTGLSLGVLVVEATVRSGSLISARCALQQNREVFAIPGSIRSTQSRGCHALIKEGAILTESINDILETFPFVDNPTKNGQKISNAKEALDSLDIQLLECLGFEINTDQFLISKLHISAQTIRSRLLNLELRGYIKAVPGGYCRVKL